MKLIEAVAASLDGRAYRFDPSVRAPLEFKPGCESSSMAGHYDLQPVGGSGPVIRVKYSYLEYYDDWMPSSVAAANVNTAWGYPTLRPKPSPTPSTRPSPSNAYLDAIKKAFEAKDQPRQEEEQGTWRDRPPLL